MDPQQPANYQQQSGQTPQPQMTPEQQWDTPQPSPAAPTGEVSDKSYVLAVIFSFLFGGIAVDRFYLGHIGTGIAKLLTFGGLGIWAIVDLFLIAFGKLKDKQGRELQGYRENRNWMRVVVIVLSAFYLLFVGGIMIALIITTYAGINSKARDTARKMDMSIVASDLAVYSTDHNGTYPSGQAFENGQYTLSDGTTLSTLTLNDIDYEPSPEGCDGVATPCKSYTLTTKLEDGTDYTLTP